MVAGNGADVLVVGHSVLGSIEQLIT